MAMVMAWRMLNGRLNIGLRSFFLLLRLVARCILLAIVPQRIVSASLCHRCNELHVMP